MWNFHNSTWVYPFHPSRGNAFFFMNFFCIKYTIFSVENFAILSLFLRPPLSRLYLILPFKHLNLQQFLYLFQSLHWITCIAKDWALLLPSFQSAEHGAVCPLYFSCFKLYVDSKVLNKKLTASLKQWILMVLLLLQWSFYGTLQLPVWFI